MDILQPSILALFYVIATAGYAWAMITRIWKDRSAPPAGPAMKVSQAPPATPVETKAAQPQPQPLLPTKQAKDKKSVKGDSSRASRLGFLRSPGSGKSPITKTSNPSTGIVKPPTEHRGFSFFRRRAASSSDIPAGAQQTQQQATKPAAQQQAVVNPAVQPAPQRTEYPQGQEEGRILIDSYPVMEPYVRIAVSQEPDGSRQYLVVEPRLTKKEREQLEEVKAALRNGLELDVSKFEPGKASTFLSDKTNEIMKKFGIRIQASSFEKLFYFIERDFLHYARIDPIMRDPNIEDISCNGPGLPVFVFHRAYDSIPTNVSFKTQEELEKFVMRLAYMSGRHISVSDPVVDAALPDGSRVQMTFGSEVTKKGSTFTIRKFKEDPYSIIDLIRYKTITAEISALMWFALENKSSVLLAGGTASGKTTTINCLALFIRPEAKIVTMEDTPEINLAHKNWIQSISRQGISGQGEITLYDLLRAALRQRPDFIIPGEVRGEEAQTMFQAISTGHAGMSSIHADSVPAVFHRLTNPPMNIPRTLLPALNYVLLQSRVTVAGKSTRRILSVTEVVGLDTRSNELITNEVYRYDAERDDYVYSGRSYILEKLAKARGLTAEEVKQELGIRKQILQRMADTGMRKYRVVADAIQRYYTDRPSLLAELAAMAT